MLEFFKKPLGIVLSGIIAVSMLTATAAASQVPNKGQWVKGDFHTHTYLSDGSYRADEVAAKARQYGLDWYGATDHGGATVGTRDENGTDWTQVALDKATGTSGELKVMPRWATIFGTGEDQINQNRKESGFCSLPVLNGTSPLTNTRA